METGKEVRQLTAKNDFRSIAYSPDGKTIVAAGLSADALFFWDVPTGRYLRHIRFSSGQAVVSSPNDSVQRLAFSSDSKTLAYARGNVYLLDTATGVEHSRLKPEGKNPDFICVAFSPDGNRLATGDAQNQVCLWESGGKHLATLHGHRETVLCVAFSPDGKIVASADKAGQIRTWDASTGKPLRQMPAHNDAVLSVLFTADGTSLIVGSCRDRICLCDLASGREIRQFAGHHTSVGMLSLSPDKRILAGIGSGGEGVLHLWEVATGKSLLPFDSHLGSIHTLAFNRDGSRLISGGDDGIVVWNVRERKIVRRLGDERTRVYTLALDSAGRRLVTAGREAGLSLWDLDTGKEVQRIPAIKDDEAECVAFAPDGCSFVSRHRTGPNELWDSASGNYSVGSVPSMTSMPGLDVASVLFPPTAGSSWLEARINSQPSSGMRLEPS